MQEVIIATKNAGKAREFERMFKPLGYEVKTLLDYPDFQDVEETGSTFEENAILKAEAVSKALGRMVIADDSGLIIDALGGKPGIYSARYAGEEKNDQKNMDKVLDELESIPDHKRQARFYCALAIASPGKTTATVAGTCEGHILKEKRGTYGFGYDPIFFAEEKNKAMAELMPEEKSQISHRANALQKLEELLPSFVAGAENS
ncbi:XTP/dITP diphosphatase [Cytobacillus firmus]|uniref:dITP/XTP pyrophosphatase n=1 Tax=Cytobacillus firmus TaxID=1399 RepID=A0A380Y1N4_CYTFI|nr:XTP/dITP diphosphatase [Cytobacillus firmus]KAF0823373.1 Nucleoside 5-triphosphatase RdgB [Cytobacillus firmus]MBG9543600.1 nucleoside-triphosphate diphosphatase [Cytobacillus firmus]MBG9546458.1 nucleoside-triphosphate diphosphatase [Cytobacillus firmus]MBG9554780.1 nucleoside-triphosphate diphosphatase [Cytobacillus firmus]MBG9555802.1 nucleoside-triphosphate diphosphatase [Cytobacillus firmus]